jgi:hypothetical protein
MWPGRARSQPTRNPPPTRPAAGCSGAPRRSRRGAQPETLCVLRRGLALRRSTPGPCTATRRERKPRGADTSPATTANHRATTVAHPSPEQDPRDALQGWTRRGKGGRGHLPFEGMGWRFSSARPSHTTRLISAPAIYMRRPCCRTCRGCRTGRMSSPHHVAGPSSIATHTKPPAYAPSGRLQRSAAPVTAWRAAGNPLCSAAWAGAAEINPRPVYRYAPRTQAEGSRCFTRHHRQPPGDDGSPPQSRAGPPRRTPRLDPAGKGWQGPSSFRGDGVAVLVRPPPHTRPGSPRRPPSTCAAHDAELLLGARAFL